MSNYIQIAGLRGHTNDYIQLSLMKGNHCNENLKMFQDDFYTLCLKDPKKNIGLRKKSDHKHAEIIFKFDEVTIDYLCSDFARFCLAILKNTSNLVCGKSLSLIPKEPIPISEELKEYIEEFLPDYYGIRDTVK